MKPSPGGHPTIEHIDISRNDGFHSTHDDLIDRVLVETAIGQLVSVDAPALTHLDISGCDLTAVGTLPVFFALRSNSHLVSLVASDNKLTDKDKVLAETLLESLEMNVSLRRLEVGSWGEARGEGKVLPALAQALALMAAP